MTRKGENMGSKKTPDAEYPECPECGETITEREVGALLDDDGAESLHKCAGCGEVFKVTAVRRYDCETDDGATCANCGARPDPAEGLALLNRAGAWGCSDGEACAAREKVIADSKGAP